MCLVFCSANGRNDVLTRPKGILLDFGATLLEELEFDRLAGRARLLEIANNPRRVTLDDYAAVCGEEAIASVWAKRDETFVEFPVVAFGRLLYERLGLTFDIPLEDVQLEFWKAAVKMRPEPGVAEALAILRGMRLPLGVVTNCSFSERTVAWELNKHGILDPFQFVMSSADYAVRKPNPAIFRTAAAKLGLDPRDIWFIGDSLQHDIAGALKAGMTAIWYNRRGAPAGNVVPHATIHSWSALADLLTPQRVR
jgi:putative hydrolase of the HAD superfamily